VADPEGQLLLCPFFTSGRCARETDISASQQTEEAQNGVPRPLSVCGWKECPSEEEGKGQKTAYGVIPLSRCFPRSARLQKTWEFDRVFRTGIRIRGELVRLLFLREQPPETKIGFAVGRRQGNAVVRSRGRRILREAFRRLLPWIRPGVLIVASLRHDGLRASARDVFDDLKEILKRADCVDTLIPGYPPLFDPEEKMVS
jgi:ribonuclease P protein component